MTVVGRSSQRLLIQQTQLPKATSELSCVDSKPPYRIQRHEHCICNTVLLASIFDVDLDTRNVGNDTFFDPLIEDLEKTMRQHKVTGRRSA